MSGVDFLTIHGVACQDYVWALAAMLWSGVAAVEWRQRTRGEWHSWLFWVGVSGLGVALTECGMLYTPVEPAYGQPAPHLFGDVVQGAAQAVLLGGWVQSLGPRRGLALLTWFVVGLVAAARWWLPVPGSWVLAIATPVLGVVWFWRNKPETARDRALRAMCALLPVLIPNGPIAELAGEARRWMEISHVAAVAGCVHCAVAAVAAWMQSQDRRTDVGITQEESRRELRGLWWVAGVWVAIGFVLASISGDLARNDFEQGILARVEATAPWLDRTAVARALGSEFEFSRERVVHQMSGKSTRFAFSPWQQGEAGATVRAMLGHVWQAIPEARAVFLRVRKDGNTVLCLAPWPESEQWGWVLLDAGISEGDRGAEPEQRGKFIGMVAFSFDQLAVARWPLRDEEGQLLAWIEVHIGVSTWLARQARARSLALAIVGLGLVVLLLWRLQRQRERGRQEAQRAVLIAQAGERAKAAFLARASHELRTPLQAILGFSRLLKVEQLSSLGRRHLDAVHSQGDLLARLVGDLLDLGATEAGQLQLAPRPLELAPLLGGVAETLRPQALAKGLGFVVETGAVPAGCWVQADAGRLQQVILNLVGNALKFTQQGEVRFEARTARMGGGIVVLCVEISDTGPGISLADQVRLFQPFQRLHWRNEVEGSGLGLAIASSLCGAMGGGLSVRSDGCSGSTFTARFVLESCEPTAVVTGEGVELLARPLVGRRVLVADDHPLIREFFATSLTDAGAECRAVASGAEAWTALCAERWDAAVIDLGLPEIDGLALAARVRGRPNAPRLVAASAAARPEDAAAARAAGFDVHLAKPLSAEALVAAVAGAQGVPRLATRELPWNDVVVASANQRLADEIRAELRELELAASHRDWPRVRQRLHYLCNGAWMARSNGLAAVLGAAEIATEDDRGAATAWERCHASLTEYIAAWPPQPIFPPLPAVFLVQPRLIDHK